MRPGDKNHCLQVFFLSSELETLATCLPKLSPVNRFLKASGSLSKPSAIVTSEWIFPSSTHCASCSLAFLKSSLNCATRKPCISACDLTSFCCTRGPLSSLLLYEEIVPHTGTLANVFRWLNTLSETGPPTFSK